VSGISAGTANISYTLVNACGTNSVSVAIAVLSKAVCDSIAGTPVVAAAGEIKLYPNPAANVVYISAPVAVNVQLMSVEGKLLQEVANATSISLEGYASGVYIAVIYDRNGLRLKEERITKLGE
jgi:hypothetical protein